MNYYLYLKIFSIIIHIISTLYVYSHLMYEINTKNLTHRDWVVNRYIIIILAIYVPLFTIILIHSLHDVPKKRKFKFIFFYPYDKLQRQECDSTNLVNIWEGDKSITTYIKKDWKRIK